MIALDVLDPAVFPLFALIVKATLLLGAAAVIDLILRLGRASASSRHLVWAAAIGGLLVLPALSALPWHVGALTIVAAPTEPPSGTQSSAVTPADRVGVVTSEVAPSPSGGARDISAAASREESGLAPVLSPRQVLLALYLIGLGGLLLRLVAGRWSLRRISDRATEVSGEEWAAMLREISWQLDVDRPVRLLRSADVGIPMTWGTIAPVILLPVEAESWTEERRRVVLMHELTHVVRHDFLTQLAAGIACAVYWFHPLVWYGSRRLRVEREIACDDRVLSAGTRPGPYVTHLLELAHACRAQRNAAAAAISMARPSQLEGRMLAAFDSARSRRVIGRSAVALAALITLIVVSAVGLLRTTTAHAATADTAGTTTQVTQEGRTTPAFRQTPDTQLSPAQTVKAQPGGTLTIDLRTGGELRIVGWDQPAVSLRSVLGGRDLRDTRVVLTSGGSDVQLKSLQSGNSSSYSTSHRFEIRVPRSYSVAVKSNGGGIEIRDVRGSFTGHTNGGPLQLNDLAGHARLTTNGGDITVSQSQLDGYVKTNVGGVRFHNVSGNLRGDSNGGAVSRTSGDTREASNSPVNINTAGGPIDVHEAPYGATLHTNGGRIHLRSAARFVHARTGGGEIILENVDGKVHATTGAGRVSVVMLNRTSSPHDVEIRSGTGAVELTLPEDFDGEFDIETGWTQSFGHRVRITSDFPLRVTESNDFEAINRGTARKRVIGRGVSGGGRNRVVVRTVNGDVIIRRRGAVSASTAGTYSDESLQPPGDGFAFVTGEGKARVGAIRAMARSAPPRAAASSLERLAFSETDTESMLAAVRELEHLGDPGLPGLIRVARTHSATSARREAIGGLGRLACEDAVSALRKVVMYDGDTEMQREAVRKLATTVQRTDVDRNISPAEITDVLREIARSHPESQVRTEAIRELAALSAR